MKRMICVALALGTTLLSTSVMASEAPVAYARTQTITVDGSARVFNTFALMDEAGAETNYVKLRDLAYTLNGTKSQFSIGYDGAITLTTATPYVTTGVEMVVTFQGDQTYTAEVPVTTVDGEVMALSGILLTDEEGGGHTYYQLRELAEVLGFTVDWSEETGITVETPKDAANVSSKELSAIYKAGLF